MSNGLLNLGNKFCHTLQNIDMDFYLTICQFHVFETLVYQMKKIKGPLNEWNVILIYYVMDFSKSQIFKLLKKPFKAFKNNYLKKIMIFFICLITL